ncbi:hypothetical protein FAUST_10522 [Fusarium austroamericanum]|uniref:Heterokaryon incompatibility domain-containing protein n=1 Tax=Fusarium austroamericanum TaxID=282268 RepID=A0AAN5Z117_FUSAU|nr:hypothetical protein FAUST_10522 [Fusarium austroamericanum]
MDPDTATWLVDRARSYGLHSCSYCQAVLLDLTPLPPPDWTYNAPGNLNGNNPRWGIPDTFLKTQMSPIRRSETAPTDRRAFVNAFDIRLLKEPFVEEILRLISDPGTSGTLIHPRIKSDKTFLRARQLLNKCLRDHDECKQIGSAPSRLLDVTLGRTRLVDTKSLKDPVWAALSYCWGGPQKSQTTYLNIQERYREISLDELPLTIRDGVYVCRQMGIQYLWIDSICIIQEDRKDDKQDLESDKDQELRKMAGIFSGAVLTIAASCASSAEEGFLHDRQAYMPGVALPVYFNNKYDIAQLVSRPGATDQFQEPEPIDNRAWTLQEQLLSSRILSFSKNTMQWHCQSEDYGISEDEIHNLGTAAKYLVDYAEGSWMRLIVEYTCRDLTNSEDRPIAIAAVAQTLAASDPDVTESDYVAGYWKPEIWAELMWFTDVKDSKRDDLPRLQGPSWSWISNPEMIRYSSPRWMSNPTSSVLSVDVDLVDPDFIFGPVKSGRIRLHGFISCHSRQMLPPQLDEMPTKTPCQVITADRRKTPPMDVFLFEIEVQYDPIGHKSIGLALQETSVPGEFVRVGSYIEVVDKKCGGSCASCREDGTREERIIEII